MKKIQIIFLTLFLTACGSMDEAAAPKVSRMEPAAGGGMTYQQFRNHEINTGSDMKAAQKRFLILDRDNNGILSSSEFNGY